MKAGIWELVIVLVIVLILFGPKALPKLGSMFGKTIGNFKKGLSEEMEDDTAETKAAASEDEPKA